MEKVRVGTVFCKGARVNCAAMNIGCIGSFELVFQDS